MLRNRPRSLPDVHFDKIIMRNHLFFLIAAGMMVIACSEPVKNTPVDVRFHQETLQRLGLRGDNWCITWTAGDDQVTSMCDGDWLDDGTWYHNRLYRIKSGPWPFEREDIPGYPMFIGRQAGWFGYGIVAVDGKLYATVSKTPGPDWSGPFRGIKLLRSEDNGASWYRINRGGDAEYLAPTDSLARNDITENEMFFMEESGRTAHGKTAFPFVFCAFVQQGMAHKAAPDDYVYIYSPEGSQPNELLLARVGKNELEQRDRWEYFQKWNGDKPVWTPNLDERGVVHNFPEKSSDGKFFGWYSWLPSVVWNEGLGLYIMVNGGTYGGEGMTDREDDFYSSWMHTATGSLGFWYSKNPYGPWTEFYYTEYWIVDNENNRTYQPKLSPKWISDDGKRMILIWSDAMKDEQGRSHAVNYLWNQMEVEIILE